MAEFFSTIPIYSRKHDLIRLTPYRCNPATLQFHGITEG